MFKKILLITIFAVPFISASDKYPRPTPSPQVPIGVVRGGGIGIEGTGRGGTIDGGYGIGYGNGITGISGGVSGSRGYGANDNYGWSIRGAISRKFKAMTKEMILDELGLSSD